MIVSEVMMGNWLFKVKGGDEGKNNDTHSVKADTVTLHLQKKIKTDSPLKHDDDDVKLD